MLIKKIILIILTSVSNLLNCNNSTKTPISSLCKRLPTSILTKQQAITPLSSIKQTIIREQIRQAEQKRKQAEQTALETKLKEESKLIDEKLYLKAIGANKDTKLAEKREYLILQKDIKGLTSEINELIAISAPQDLIQNRQARLKAAYAQANDIAKRHNRAKLARLEGALYAHLPVAQATPKTSARIPKQLSAEIDLLMLTLNNLENPSSRLSNN